MIVLGIESTCDETAVGLVEGGRRILSHAVASSIDVQEKYGGVFPELACRRHIEVIGPVVQEAVVKAGVSPADIDLIAVAKGPGLVGALLIGMHMAKGLAISWQKPLIGVNHVEAHLYASLMGLNEPWPFPALGVVLSGGHTLLVKISDIGSYERIGTTVDDAIGEAFDKVAVLLGLPYPGGPPIERLAKEGNPKAHPFTAGRVKKSPFDFSFSGLKTSVRYAFQEQTLSKADVAASFQEVALNDVVNKAKLAMQTFPCQAIIFGGGVCSNLRLRQLFAEEFPDKILAWPPGNLSLDNGVMIAGLGYHRYLEQGHGDALDLEVGCIKPCL